MPDKIIGFSKLSRDEKISWVSKNFLNNSDEFESILNKYLNDDKNIQSIHNSLSENVISNFHLPYSCLLYTSPSPRDRQKSRMPSSA